ncbi:hypothetical protein [Acaryochloris sp. IP29b_bin.137]|nr:hypothetical protein [Acaryochloris sp. IP29b_bin.137]
MTGVFFVLAWKGNIFDHRQHTRAIKRLNNGKTIAIFIEFDDRCVIFR